MIAKLTGKVDVLRPTELILDVHGVGYNLSIPFTTFEHIKNSTEISLFVYTLHKEDQMRLFGFHSEVEKDLFAILISVSGIGPAIALSILSSISPSRLKEAVAMEHPLLLTGIPGIGKTKAEKIVFELKRKMKNLEVITDDISPHGNAHRNAVDALITLGYDENRSVKTVNAVVNNKPDMSVEDIIKESLKMFAG